MKKGEACALPRAVVKYKFPPERAYDSKLLYGSSITKFRTSIITTRHYRAPEVIMGLGWSFASDIWSVGLIIAEFFMGRVIFQAQHNREQVAMMERLIGPFPKWMISASDPHTRTYFDRNGRVIFPEPGVDETTKYVDDVPSLSILIPPSKYPRMYEFVKACLSFDPNLRPTASEALSFDFLNIYE